MATNKKEWFKFDMDSNPVDLVLTYVDKPTIKQVKADLAELKNRFIAGSKYNEFTPVIGRIYPFCFGWETGYRAHLTNNIEDTFNKQWIYNGFPDEIHCKGKRTIYKF